MDETTLEKEYTPARCLYLAFELGKEQGRKEVYAKNSKIPQSGDNTAVMSKEEYIKKLKREGASAFSQAEYEKIMSQ